MAVAYAPTIRNAYDAELSALASNLGQRGNLYTPLERRTMTSGFINKFGGKGISPQEIEATLNNIYGHSQEIPSGGGAAQQSAAASTGGGGYGAVAQPQVALGDYIRQLNDIYNGLYGDINNIANERRGQLEKTYGKQFQDLSKSYEDTNQGLLNTYGARGLADSSYKNKGITRAGDIYKSDTENLRQGYQSNLADIGKFASTARSGFEAGQKALSGIGQYGTQQDAQTLQSQIGQLNQQRAGLGTQSSYINQLNSIAPTQSQGPSQLQKQLQDLVGTSAPAFAKNQVAGALIQQQGQEGQQNYWQDYFQKLLGTGSQVG